MSTSRFEPVPEQVYNMVFRVMKDSFPQLDQAVFHIVWDTKKRASGGKYVIGRIQKTNDLLRHLTETNEESEADYILYLDKLTFEHLDDIDKIRVIRHELQHCDVDFEKNQPYCVRSHEVEDFYEEIQRNADDPRWAERVATVADSLYNKEDGNEE